MHTAATRPIFANVPIIRSARQRLNDAVNLPPIDQLIGPVWHSGELHLMFGDTGSGKSVLGVQFADALSKGNNVLPALKNESDPMRCLYYDFELSDKQFLKRYTQENGDQHNFSDNLFIDNVDFPLLMAENPSLSFSQLLQEKIKHDLEIFNAKVLFIDNLTYLHTQSAADPQAALEVMRFLDGIKRQFSISILVIAHTPKIPNNLPLTINHLAGSKMLSNFADGVSAVGKSEMGKDVRYLKQIKPSRSAELVYDRDNVLSMELTHSNSFLHFDYIGCESEFKHLTIDDTPQDERKLQALDLHKGGETIREIAKIIGVSKSTISNWIKSHETPF
jgi:archaellum biogenesis ATPase FlaH